MFPLSPFIQQLIDQSNLTVTQRLVQYPHQNNPYLFPLYPHQNNPYYILPPPPFHASIHASINTPQFDGNRINEYFDYYATPHDQRLGLLRLFMQGQRSPWMWSGPHHIPVEIRAPGVVATSSAPSPPWTDLPEDVTADIMQKLGAAGMLLIAQRVCSAWWKACKDPDLWRVIDFSDPNQRKWTRKYTAMCRHAVDRSQGRLVDLTIQYFGDDALMDYVVDR